LLDMRHTNPALLDGDYVAVNESDANVFSYLRRYKNEAVLVVLNMSPDARTASFDLSADGFGTKQAKTLLTTTEAGATQGLSSVPLGPYQVYVGEVTK